MPVSPDGRRSLAHLGLTVLVIGLVVAPLSHLLVDHGGLELGSAAARAWLTHGEQDSGAHAHPHSHADERDDRSERGGHRHHHEHRPGDVQHLTALFAPAAAPPPLARTEAVSVVQVRRPAALPRPAERVHPAMPQGP